MASGMFRGKVTRVTSRGAFVEVLRLNRAHVYGPVPVVEGPWTSSANTDPAGGGEELPEHTHGLGPNLAAGDRVLVAFLEGRPDDLVILGRLR